MASGMKTKSLHSSVIADVVFILVPYSSPKVHYKLGCGTKFAEELVNHPRSQFPHFKLQQHDLWRVKHSVLFSLVFASHAAYRFTPWAPTSKRTWPGPLPPPCWTFSRRTSSIPQRDGKSSMQRPSTRSSS